MNNELTEASKRTNKSFLFLSNPVILTCKYRRSLSLPFPFPVVGDIESYSAEESGNDIPGAPYIFGERNIDTEGDEDDEDGGKPGLVPELESGDLAEK